MERHSSIWATLPGDGLEDIWAAMAQGLDAAIIDPTDRELMAGLVAAEAILDQDKFCAGYITAYRQGKLA